MRATITIPPELISAFEADRLRANRRVKPEVEYLMKRGLEAVQNDMDILAGRTQIDMAALRVARE